MSNKTKTPNNTEAAQLQLSEAPVMQVLPLENAPAAIPTEEPEQPATPAPVEPTSAPQSVPALPPTLAQIQDKIRQMKTVSDRLDYLTDTAINLSEFALGRSGMTDELTIRDGNGKVWKTNKSETIQKVLDLLQAELAGHINTAEAELRTKLVA